MARQPNPERPIPPTSTDLSEWTLYYQTLAVEAAERRYREYLAWQAEQGDDYRDMQRWER